MTLVGYTGSRRRLSGEFFAMGAYDQAIAAGQRARATAGGEVVLQVLSNFHLGSTYWAQGDYLRAIDYFEPIVVCFDGTRRYERTSGSVFLPGVQSRAWLAACHAELGTFAEGRALGDEGLQIAEAMAHPASLVLASWGSGLLALRQGDLPRALLLLERAVGLCQDLDFLAYFTWTAEILGAAYTLEGRVADAVPLLTRAMEQITAMGMVAFQAFCSLSLGEAQMRAGRLEEASALVEGHASAWLVSARNVVTRPMPCACLATLPHGASLLLSSPPRPTISTPSPWPRNSACARCRRTVTTVSARCTARQAVMTWPAPPSPPPSRCTVPWT